MNERKEKFTPGPYQVLPPEDGVLYIRVRGTKLGEKYKIANCPFVLGNGRETFDMVEARRNADLIAAAPEQYDWLAKFEAKASAHEFDRHGDRFSVRMSDSELAELRALLAKARGDS